MAMTTDPIAAARALIEPLTGYTPKPWDASGLTVYDTCMDGVASCHAGADARLIAAAPDLRDMIATLADALETERAKVAAAFKAGVKRGVAHAAGHTCEDEGCPHYGTRHAHPGDLEAPSDAQVALDKLLAEARLEGWRAGREAAAEYCWTKRDVLADAEQKQVAAGLTGRDYYGRRLEAELLSRAIRALPEPKEASHD